MVGPDAFTEVRFLQHYKQTLALRLIPEFAADFKTSFGRDTGGLLRTYRAEDAEMIVVAMGSINGTIKDAIDEMRDDGVQIGLVTIVSFRPFPTEALREELVRRKQRRGGRKELRRRHGRPARQQCRSRLAQLAGAPQVHSVIAGLGGRPITRAFAASLFRQALAQPWEGAHFLDLNEEIVGKELHHVRKVRRSGPTAENLLRRLGQDREIRGVKESACDRTHDDIGRHPEAPLLPERHLHRRQPAGPRSANARCRPRSTAPTR